MAEFKRYRRKESFSELRVVVAGESLPGSISISAVDRARGHPKVGDMIARNPSNHADQWLMPKAYFADHYDPNPVPDDVKT